MRLISKTNQAAPRAVLVLAVLGLATCALAQTQPTTTTKEASPKKPTLAVLPFVPSSSDSKDKDLAERMRFAVSQKLSSDANANAANGSFDRLDNVQVDQLLSALGISFAKTTPDDDEFQKLLSTLDTQFTISGALKGRQLTLTLYQNATVAKTATTAIPPDNQSPKLAVEKILTDLTGTAFAHIRDTEVDHSDAKAEARFDARPNLVPDPSFELAAMDPKHAGVNWEALLGPQHYAPLMLTTDIAALTDDLVAIVPTPNAPAAQATALSPQHSDNTHCLLLHMTKPVAESNGLACESTWIPVEANKKYRFTALYHSEGPVARLFLKGFAEHPDQFSDPQNPESSRREYYRAQILPRKKNAGWDLIEMDFTPSTLKPTDPQIQWLRIDLYTYLTPGNIYFDQVTLKKLDE